MDYGKYKFTCRFERDAILPAYKGSTFRGVFGRSLKQVVCALRNNECPECLLRGNCFYARVFETPVARKVAAGARMSEPPHPFIIEPPLTDKTDYAAGETFDVSLTLFGEANQNFPYFLYAFDRMGRIGLGRRIGGRRGQFTVETVTAGGHEIYSVKEKKMTLPEEKAHLTLAPVKADGNSEKRLRLHILTPFRFKYGNSLMRDELPFHVLTRAMLRRIAVLMEHYDQGEPPLDYPGLINRSHTVSTTRSDIRWYDWERFSFRQKQRMPMGGILGSVEYRGRLDEFLPLLDFSSKVNLGKNTSFGLGKVYAEVMQ